MQVASLTGAIRQYNLSWAINDYLKIHPQACVVEMGAELSCLRRQMKNNSNDWINLGKKTCQRRIPRCNVPH